MILLLASKIFWNMWVCKIMYECFMVNQHFKSITKPKCELQLNLTLQQDILSASVELSDPGSMKYSHIIEQSPCDWETFMCQNVVLIIFHIQNIFHHAWKTVRTTLQCIIGLQSWGEGHEIEKNCGTNPSHSFPCTLYFLPGIGEQQNIKV